MYVHLLISTKDAVDNHSVMSNDDEDNTWKRCRHTIRCGTCNQMTMCSHMRVILSLLACFIWSFLMLLEREMGNVSYDAGSFGSLCSKQQGVQTIQWRHSYCLHNTTTSSVKDCTCNSSGIELSMYMDILEKRNATDLHEVTLQMYFKYGCQNTVSTPKLDKPMKCHKGSHFQCLCM